MSDDKKSESLSLKLLRGEVLAQGCLLRALTATHPDAGRLMQHFKNLSEQYISQTLAGETDDISIRAFEVAVKRLERFAE